MRIGLRKVSLVLALSLVLAVGAALLILSPAKADGPPSGSIHAELVPPRTTYTAMVTDPDGDTLHYQWSAQISCGTFIGDGDIDYAFWDHPNGTGPGECDHSDGTSHEGTI